MAQQQTSLDLKKYRKAFSQWYTDAEALSLSTRFPGEGDKLYSRRIAHRAWCSALRTIGCDHLDRSDTADAARFRWILNGNGYFMEEESLCGHGPCSEEEQDDARLAIDQEIKAAQQDGAA